MTRRIGLWALPFVTVFLAAQTTSNGNPRTIVINHVTVIDATGAPERPDSTVVVTNNRIAAIGPSRSVHRPTNAQVVNGTGKFLIPGLWDMHVHLDYKDYLPLFIANGVTGVRVMWGDPVHHQWREDIASSKLLGPRMMIASAVIDGPEPLWPSSVSVSTEAQARDAVVNAKKGDADFIKVYQFLPRDLYFAIADESKKQGLPFEGHVPNLISAEEASRAGQKSFEHLIGVLPSCSTRSDEWHHAEQSRMYSPRLKAELNPAVVDEVLGSFSEEKAAALSSILRENGTWQCPTLTVLHMLGYGDDPSFRSDPRLKYMPARMVAWWDLTYGGIRNQDDIAAARKEFQKDLEIVGIMQRLGVGILAGTDTQNPFSLYGFSLHDELGFLVRAGLTPMQALQSATLNPARFFARERDLGTIEKGKFADLVLLDADPLIDIGNTRKIDAVLLDGNIFSRAALDEMLAKVEILARRKGVSEVLIQTIQEKGVNAALAQYRDLKLTRRDIYDFSEDDLIALGYRLINMHKYNEAIAVLGLSVEEYPASYNAYDSLAEAYMDNGNTELAIQNYKKSLELNPNNKNGIEMLKKLTAR